MYLYIIMIIRTKTKTKGVVSDQTLSDNKVMQVYVTVHAERDHKSAIVILRYGGVRQKRRILSFSIFFAQGMRKAL